MSKVMRKKVASILTTAMVVGSTPIVGHASEVSNVPQVNNEISISQEIQTERTTSAAIKVLDTSVLANATLSTDLVAGDFIIKAATGKTVSIDGSVQTTEYHHNLTKRIKFGGAGSTVHRSVQFETSGPAEVTLYALSSSDTEDRPIAIYDATGNLVKEVTAYGMNTIAAIDKDKDRKSVV